MKRTLIITLCIVMLLGIFAPLSMAGTELPDVPAILLKFKDLSSRAWYFENVNYVFTEGLFSGVSDTEFAPTKAMTRAEFVQVLANLEGEGKDENVTSNFSDVKSGDWYAPAVVWANEQGIVAGYDDGSFKPNAEITREQMCVMLVNYVAAKNKFAFELVEGESAFADNEKISEWAKEAVKTCQMSDIINGKLGNVFDPQGKAERSHVASIFTQFHRKYKSQI